MAKQKIPKVIHYVWLGDKPLDKLSKKCIKTWKNVLPEYKIICWDDKKSKRIIENNLYAKQAYKAKKYAFVSDYIRLYVLYNNGGVYMDTDVRVIKNIDNFLEHSAFSSFENEEDIPTALMGSEKHGTWIGKLLEYYDERQFVDNEGNYDLRTNVSIITEMSINFGLIRNGKKQILSSGVHIYPREYFCPLDTKNSRNNKITDNTHAIHLFNGSWTPLYRRVLSKIKKKLGLDLKKILGEKLYNNISNKF